MFITQCIDKAMIERAGKIMKKIFRFLPVHLKSQNAVITQQECLRYLNNDNTDKLVLLDVPYIGSEHTCAVTGYKYQPFHKKVTDCLQDAELIISNRQYDADTQIQWTSMEQKII